MNWSVSHRRSTRLLLAVWWLPCVVVAFANAAVPALPFLSPIFGDHMVLQRGKTNAIWGWTAPGETVRVSIGDRVAAGAAGTDGRWEVSLEPPATGGPYEMTIRGGKEVVLRDVLVGDVWLCGGQSNMEFPIPRSQDGEEVMRAATHPRIRFFVVGSHPAYSPAAVPRGEWKVTTPETARTLSAVGYFFARAVQEKTGVPIGLVQDCLGGTPAESWMSPEGLRRHGDFDTALNEVERLRSSGAPEYGNYIAHWYDRYDRGAKEPSWTAPGFDDKEWKTVRVPGAFAALGLSDVPSVVWLRREFELPEPLPAGGAKLRLGQVDKMDTSFLNGRWVGASSWVENPRAYGIPADVLKPGRNVLTLRLFKLKSAESFLDGADALQLELGDGTRLPLAGDGWKALASVDARPPHPLPLGFENYPTMPVVLYHGMIQPVAPLALTGAIWYQGEANTSRAYQYRTLLPAMIADWRAVFRQGDFPFYIAGLPAFTRRKEQPGDDSWAELREAQALAARTVAKSGLAVTIDSGDAADIHPKEKRVVGERLALVALASHYGVKIASRGPELQSVEAVAGQGALRLKFAHAEGGLVAKGGPPGEFAVAGADRKWFWADAVIEGGDVVVSSSSVPEPKAVRYAWQGNPAATLFNRDGLPAVPFRTDDWPGITEPNRTGK